MHAISQVVGQRVSIELQLCPLQVFTRSQVDLKVKVSLVMKRAMLMIASTFTGSWCWCRHTSFHSVIDFLCCWAQKMAKKKIAYEITMSMTKIMLSIKITTVKQLTTHTYQGFGWREDGWSWC